MVDVASGREEGKKVERAEGHENNVFSVPTPYVYVL